MTDLEIYTSQGEQFGTDQPAVSSRIENFFFDGVRLYVETEPTVELVAFFRARESEASRADQYYAVYRTDTTRQLFSRFLTALRERIEDDHGMLLQTTSEDVQVFAGLNADHESPGSTTELDSISTLLSEGRRLSFGVPTAGDALGLLQQLDSSARRVAITEDAAAEELDDCDIIIELGSYDGLTPLGSTEGLLAEKQRRRTGSSRPRTTNVSSDQPEPGKLERTKRKLKRIGGPVAASVGTFLVLLLLIVIGLNGAVFADLIDPGPFGPVIFI